MVKTKNLTLMVTAAVLAALTCVATMVVQIPMPLTKGYVNLGDVMVLTSVWLIGSPWGVAAAGIGSAMADLLTGYAYYAPATLIIKALMAVAAFYIAKCFMNGSYFKSLVGKVIGGTVAESTCQVEREKMNRTLYHQAGNSIPVVIFEAMFKAMFEQGIIEVGS